MIGLTGGIGSGKSTVSARLASKGALVVDADAITKELQQPGTEVFLAIQAHFGSGVVSLSGELDRPALADVVFNDADELRVLNSIVHPAVGAEIGRRIADAGEDEGILILDVPLLVETGRGDLELLVVVDVDEEIAIRRLVEGRNMAEADARARMSRQASRAERIAKADIVIDNSGTLAELEAQIDSLWVRIASD